MRTSIVALLLGALLTVAAGGHGWDKASAAAGIPASKEAGATNAGAEVSVVQLADRLYAAVNAGNRQLAYSTINRLQQAAAKPVIRQAGKQPGWAAFDRSILDARQALSEGKGNEAYLQAARLKLAADALFRKAPLWLQYREVLKNDMVRIRQAWHSQGVNPSEAALATLSVLQLHAKRIEIAALMGQPEKQVSALYDQIKRTERTLVLASNTQSNKRLVEGSFSALEKTVDALFGSDGAAAVDALLNSTLPQTIGESRRGREQLATMYISAFILGVLGYVGWRRYRFDQNHGSSYPPTDGVRRN
ncbi:sporulation protein YpjB [Paenibacillus spongiae]|uniref:Sporulation protein YpjB n=1 Tax=Paenibacillus spongiae TaxID=2909671 RepID=A0ABY5SEL8_9BACL|nr:sporulation protein YpjB [Paenibacillus spongiae]UVI32417.1 sporulation protein YpjB [Paenibacillus spongiae]